MNIRGKARSISMDFETGDLLVTFSTRMCREELQAQYDRIKSADNLEIKAVRYRERRSLDANAYFHVLVGKIAESLSISKPRAKNLLIGRYGQPELLEDGTEVVLKSNIPVTTMLEQELLHCRACGVKMENGQEMVIYKVLRGSHTYNTKEMSCLIDGTVQDAKELGIETIPPDELARMVGRWHGKETV